jgi:hypothetical protein
MSKLYSALLLIALLFAMAGLGMAISMGITEVHPPVEKSVSRGKGKGQKPMHQPSRGHDGARIASAADMISRRSWDSVGSRIQWIALDGVPTGRRSAFGILQKFVEGGPLPAALVCRGIGRHDQTHQK